MKKFLLHNSKISIKRKYCLRRVFDNSYNITANVGDKVTKDQVIAYGKNSETLQIIDLVQVLKVNRTKVKNYLKCIDGEIVQRGDILAQKKSAVRLTKEVVLAPVGGRVDLRDIHRGKLAVRSIVRERVFEAGIKGEVKEVVPGKYIDIQSDFVELCPLKIIGKNKQGTMYFVSKGLIESGFDVFDKGMKDSILATDYNVDFPFLKKLSGVGVKGLILSSMKLSVLEKFESSKISKGLTVVILGGFGEITMNEEFEELLEMNDSEFISVDYKSGSLFLSNISKAIVKKYEVDKKLKRIRKGSKVRMFTLHNWGERAFVQSKKGDIWVLRGENREIKRINCNNLLVE